MIVAGTEIVGSVGSTSGGTSTGGGMGSCGETLINIKTIAVPVLAHRLISEDEEYKKKSQRVQGLLKTVAVPTEDWTKR